jgi:hypothetical protein
LHGGLSLLARDSLVESFNSTDDVRILLVSITAGGEGLNLQAADRVLIVDPWWNPAVEWQAIHRSYRIGQPASSVFVTRFVTRDTIEERIVFFQTMKGLMAKSLLDDSVEASAKLDENAVAFLFSLKGGKRTNKARKVLPQFRLNLGQNTRKKFHHRPTHPFDPDIVGWTQDELDLLVELRQSGTCYGDLQKFFYRYYRVVKKAANSKYVQRRIRPVTPTEPSLAEPSEAKRARLAG